MCHKHAQICVQLVDTFHMLEPKETQISRNKNNNMLKCHSSNEIKSSVILTRDIHATCTWVEPLMSQVG